MTADTLSILTPSVNDLFVRIFVRAAGLEFEEVNVWGEQGTTEFLAKDPADLTPLLEEAGLPKGALWEATRSCSSSATGTVSARSIRPTPRGGRWSTARCSSRSGRCVRSCAGDVSRARVPAVPGEVGASSTDAR